LAVLLFFFILYVFSYPKPLSSRSDLEDGGRAREG
jgi:hypothetical protein